RRETAHSSPTRHRLDGSNALCPLSLLVACLLIFLGTTTGQAEPPDLIPPPLTEYHGRRIAPTMHYAGASWLVRESRQREEDCETMLRELKLEPGMIVCDMGCGNGFYTLKMADAVGPEGKVYAV